MPPLESGGSPATISKNIHELTANGSRPRSHEQIVAIALHNADVTKRGRGSAGNAGHFTKHLRHS